MGIQEQKAAGEGRADQCRTRHTEYELQGPHEARICGMLQESSFQGQLKLPSAIEGENRVQVLNHGEGPFPAKQVGSTGQTQKESCQSSGRSKVL